MTTIPQTPPQTYAEWALFLELIENRTDDNQILAILKQGSLDFPLIVEGRFEERFLTLIINRLRDSLSKFSKEYQQAQEEWILIQALGDFRKEYQFLYELSSISSLPSSTKTKAQKFILDHANGAQEALERGAQDHPSPWLVGLLRSNRINNLSDSHEGLLQ